MIPKRTIVAEGSGAAAPGGAGSGAVESPDGALPLYRILDWFVVLFAAGAIGYHIALLTRTGLVVFVVASSAVFVALLRFLDLGCSGRRNRSAVQSDDMTRVALYGASALVAVAAIVAIWPGPRKGFGAAAVVAGVMLVALAVARWKHGFGQSTALAPELVVLLGSVAAVVAVIMVWTLSSWLLAGAFVLFFGAVVAVDRMTVDDGEPDPVVVPSPRFAMATRRDAVIVLSACAIVLAGIMVFAPKGNDDDLSYVRVANVAAESLWRFPTGDLVHGIPEGSFVPPADLYQVTETFVGLAARLTGLNALQVVQFGTVSLTLLLAPFAFARFAQGVGSRRPTLVAVVACALVLSAHTLVSERAITGKITQGKGFFLLVLLPVLLAAAADHWARPDRARLRFLLVAGIACLGATASGSGLVLPVIGVAAVGAIFREGFRSWRGPGGSVLGIALTGALALYPLVILALGTVADGTEDEVGDVGLRGNIGRGLLGSIGRFARWDIEWSVAAALILMLLGLALIPRRRHRRYLAALFALVVFVILNPALLEVASRIADATRVAWRFAWLFPSAVLIGVAVEVLSSRARVLGMMLTAGLLGITLTLGPANKISNSSTFPEVDTLDLVTQADWEAAAAIHAATRPGDTILMPKPLVRAVTLRYTDRHSVMVRSIFLTASDRYPLEVTARRTLARNVEAPGEGPERGVRLLVSSLEKVAPDGVCVPATAHPNFFTALAEEYRPVTAIPGGNCELWLRGLPSDPAVGAAPCSPSPVGEVCSPWSVSVPPVADYRIDDVGVADVDGDGDLDVFTSNHISEQSLLVNDGAGGFRDAGDAMGYMQDRDFPGLEDANAEPTPGTPGLYTYWWQRQLVVVGHDLEEPVTGSIGILSDVGVAASTGVESSIERTTLASGQVVATVDFVAEEGQARLVLDFEARSAPVTFSIDDRLPLDAIFVGSMFVHPAGHEFTTALRDRHGAAWADLDGDPQLEVAVTRGGLSGKMALYPLTFYDELLDMADDGMYADLAEQRGLQKGNCSSRQAAWVDYDGDGLLDLYVGCARNQPNQLHRQGPDGSFAEIAAEVGLDARSPGPFVWFDVDDDGDPDLILSESDGITLYTSAGGVFTPRQLVERPAQAVQLRVVDFDRDGRLDVFAFSRPGNVLLAGAPGGFTVVDLAALGLPEASVEAAWVDFDNDGRSDLYAVPGGLYLQQTDGTFATSLLVPDGPDVRTARANWFDADGDGRRELLLGVLGVGEESPWRFVLLDHAAEAGHWLEVDLVGPPGNGSAIGATVALTAGGSTQLQMVGSSEGSRFSSGHHRLYFGMGESTIAGEILVVWPDGTNTRLTDVPGDQMLTVEHGAP